MNIRWWNDNSKLEARLRAARPEAPDELVRRLSAQTRSRRAAMRPTPRIALAGVASAVMLVGIAAMGGVGRAASDVAHAVQVATGHTSSFGTQMAVAVKTSNAANNQYGGQTVSVRTSSKAAVAGIAGAITVNAPAPGNGQAAQHVAVNWQTTTFTTPVTIHVDPTPPQVTSSALLGSNNQLVSVIVTDSAGNAIHQLSAPMDILFQNPPKGFVPVVSTDGVNFRALTLVTGPGLPAGQSDGYYKDANGDIHILTMHLTMFAVLYSANANLSETGKKTPQAGSGLFGDPTRNHVGAPRLVQVGSTIRTATVRGATVVPFTFHVDEQAATYVSIYDAFGNPVTIDRNGTLIRGHRYSGTPVKTLHLVINRPGQISTKLKVPAGLLKAGQPYKIRVTAVDFDGHKTVTYATFTA